MLGYGPMKAGRQQARVWRFGAGEVNDFMGPGDGQTLSVRFDSRGRVTGTSLLYPAD